MMDDGEIRRRGPNDDLGCMFDIKSRRVGVKLIRLGTPIEQIRATETQSPSNNKADMMLLPGFSLADYENERARKAGGVTRAQANMEERQAEKDQASATSGPGKSVQKMLNRMTKQSVARIDYLTPARKAREFRESLKGDHTVDFKKMQQKARQRATITTKQPAFLTHMRDDPTLGDEDGATVGPVEKQPTGAKG